MVLATCFTSNFSPFLSPAPCQVATESTAFRGSSCYCSGGISSPDACMKRVEEFELGLRVGGDEDVGVYTINKP